MKMLALIAILLGLSFLTTKCEKPGKPTNVTPQQAVQIRHTIINYLECEECEDQFESVVKLRELAVPSLAVTLHEGPSQVKLELLRRGLITNYRKLKEYEQTHPEVKVPGTEEQYVKTYLNNYVASYQARAAMALGAIGGLEARRALEEASRMPLRSDVQAAVKASLEKLK